MSELDLSLRLKADASGLVGTVRVSKRELDKLTKSTDKSGKGMKRFSKGVDRADKSARALNQSSKNLSQRFTSLKGILATFGVGLVIRDIVRAGQSFEGLTNQLKASTGGLASAATEIRFIRQESNRLGIQFQQSASDYAQLLAAAKGTVLQGQATRDIFTAIAEASRVMNLSVSETSGAVRAITQIMSKGTVQAEELRGQLGERIPGAFQIAARAMNVTTSELGKMLEQGEVLAEDLLPKLAVELRRSVADGLEDAVGSSAAEFSRLGNAVGELKIAVASSGLLSFFAGIAKLLTNTVIPSLKLFIENLGIIEFKIDSLTLDEQISRLNQAKEEQQQIANEIVLLAKNTGGAISSLDLSRLEAANQKVDSLTSAVKKSRLEMKGLASGASKTGNSIDNMGKKINNAGKKTGQLAKQQQDFIKSLKEERRLLKFTGKELEIQTALGRAHELGIKDQDKAIRELVGSMYDLAMSQEAATASLKPIAEIYADTARSIRQSFRDTFRDILDNGIDGFKGMADKIKNIFKDMLADLLTLAASRKIIIPIVTSIGGSLGISQAAIASVTQQLGGGAAGGASAAGGGGLGGIGNLAGLAGIGKSGFINVPGLGPLSTASLGTAALGLGAGFLGNSAGNYVSGALGINVNDGGNIGGTLGGIGGFILGGPVGAAIGSALGNIAGNVIGDLLGFGKSKSKIRLGSAEDSASASALGFNNRRETPFGFVGITRDSNLFGGGRGSAVTDAAAKIDNAIASLLTATQIEDVKTALSGTTTSKLSRSSFEASDVTNLVKQRLIKVIDAIAGNSVASEALSGINNFKKLSEEGLKIVTLIQEFKSVMDDIEPINKAEQALKTINLQFDNLSKAAIKLGFSVDEVEQKRADAVQQLTTDFNQSIRDQILSIEDPFTQILENLDKVADERLDNARTLGADLVELERLSALERAAIIEQQFGSLNDLINELTLSSLSPTQQLDSLISDFNAAIESNDINSLNALTRNILTVGSNAFASGPQFQELKNQIVAALLAVQDRAATNTQDNQPPITIRFELDGRVITEQTINDLLARSEQGEIVVHSNGVAE